jgi:GT2 family glycosyltransferase
MFISFIVPVRDDARALALCLESVKGNVYPRDLIEFVVADNGSTDESPAVARAHGARLLSLPGVRVAGLRNKAAAVARGDVLAFVDADHEIAPEWIAGAVDVLRDERIAAVGAIYSAPAAGTSIQRTYGVLRGRTVGRHETAWLSSGNLAVRRIAFEQIGGFDESLETCEDVELCQRLHVAGWRVVADERLWSVHKGDPKTLRELFVSERWRGRDNLRVSLRHVGTVRELPSIVIPVLDLIAMAVGGASVLASLWAGKAALRVAVVAAVVFVALSGLRAARMARSRTLVGLRDVFTALAVALTYDAARALALIWPAAHRRLRGAHRARIANRTA